MDSQLLPSDCPTRARNLALLVSFFRRPRQPVLPYSVVSRLLGLLLLVAAGLKLNGLGSNALGVAILCGPQMQIVVVELEIALGILLLHGSFPTVSWFICVIAFAIFAGVSGYLGWAGASSCGCFGRMGEGLSPWYAFAIDLGALAALVLSMPQGGKTNQGFTALDSLAPVFRIACGVAAILGASALVGYLFFGSVEEALAYVRGESVSVVGGAVDLGEGLPGEERTGTVYVRNRGDRPIRLVGGRSDCSCVVIRDLPLDVPCGEVRAVSVKIRVSGAPGKFTHKAFLITDAPQSPRVLFRLTGRSLGPDFE